MARKRTNLASAMKKARGDDEAVTVTAPEKTDAPATGDKPAAETAPTTTSIPPSRQGKKFVGGYFPPEVLRQLKMVGLQHDKTNQDLVAEALNLVFEKYGQNPIA